MTQNQKRLEKRKIETEKEKARFPTKESVKHMSFALGRGMTIYPAAQMDGTVKLFKQFGENFKELNPKTFSQTEDSEILEMLYLIKKGYEAYYNKFKK
jgi:hypothetical protein